MSALWRLKSCAIQTGLLWVPLKPLELLKSTWPLWINLHAGLLLFLECGAKRLDFICLWRGNKVGKAFRNGGTSASLIRCVCMRWWVFRVPVTCVFTSEHRETLNLLAEDLFQFSCIWIHIVVHLFCHLQQHLFILQPSDGLLRAEQSDAYWIR